jgi:hypothetical protein
MPALIGVAGFDAISVDRARLSQPQNVRLGAPSHPRDAAANRLVRENAKSNQTQVQDQPALAVSIREPIRISNDLLSERVCRRA